MNNLIYDPGPRAVHYNLILEEWGEPADGSWARWSLIGNVMRAGPSTPSDVAFFMLGGSGDVEIYAGRQHRRGSHRPSAAELRAATPRARRAR